MSARAIRRRMLSGAMTGLVGLLCAAAVLPLVLIFADLLHKGATSIDWNFFVRTPVPIGQTGGGVAHAIVGSAIIVGTACLIGLPIGIGAGIYLAEYGTGRLGWTVRFVADVLNGTPSIVIGMFEDKDVEAVARILAPLAGAAYACVNSSSRAASVDRVANALKNGGAPIAGTFDTVAAAVQAARDAAGADDLILITGSFYTVADARPLFVGG